MSKTPIDLEAVRAQLRVGKFGAVQRAILALDAIEVLGQLPTATQALERAGVAAGRTRSTMIELIEPLIRVKVWETAIRNYDIPESDIRACWSDGRVKLWNGRTITVDIQW